MTSLVSGQYIYGRGKEVGRKRGHLVRTISIGARISAVIVHAATATPSDASGSAESAISPIPGSGSDSTADKNDPVQLPSVRTRMLYTNVAF